MSAFETESVLVQLNGKVTGPFPVKQLRRMQGFTVHSLISFPGTDKWAPAHRVLNMKSYEPPAAYQTVQYDQKMDWSIPSNPASSPAVFDWQASQNPEKWSDRWFRRLAIFNTLLVMAACAAASYPPIRIPLERELRQFMSEQEMPARLMMVRLIYPKPEPRPTSNRTHIKSGLAFRPRKISRPTV